MQPDVPSRRPRRPVRHDGRPWRRPPARVTFLVLLGVFVIAAVLVGGAMSLFFRRHVEQRPDAGWVPTGEVVRDPDTDRLAEVWVDASGGRHYLPQHTGGSALR